MVTINFVRNRQLGSVILFGIFLVSAFIIPFYVNDICRWISLSTDRSGFIVAVHEAICSALSFSWLLYIRKKSERQQSWEKYFPLVFICLSFADLAYGVHYYFLNHVFKNTPGFLIHQIPYILVMYFLSHVTIMRSFENTKKKKEKYLIGGAIAAIAAIYFACSYKMVLSYHFPAGYQRPTANFITSYIYGILQSISMGGLVVASLRTPGLAEFFQWFLFVTMNGSDFALRYQDVGAHKLGTPMFEYGWEIAVAGISALILFRRLGLGQTDKLMNEMPTPVNSIRVLAPLSTLSILALFVVLNLVSAPYFEIANINTISGHTLIFAFVWLTANGMGLYLSQILSDRIRKLNLQIESAQSLEDLDKLRGNLVEMNPVFQSLKQMKIQLSHSMEENLKARSLAAVASTASRVVHNIRSPLSALEMGLSIVPDMPANADSIIRKSLGEIKSFVKDLEAQSRKFKMEDHNLGNTKDIRPKTVEQISKLVELSVAQKKIELHQRSEIQIILEINENARSLYSELDSLEFSTIISNLVNNAVDEMQAGGQVKVLLSRDGNFGVLQVVDNGKGIAAELLPNLGTLGFTHGKKHGTGRGLHDAKKAIEAWDGRISFHSELGKGVCVSIQLPDLNYHLCNQPMSPFLKPNPYCRN